MSIEWSKDAFATADRGEISALQLRRLRDTIHRASTKAPHYKQKFGKVNLKSYEIASLEDIAQFPFTTKQDLRSHYPLGMLAVPMDDIVRVHASTGTTGSSTVIYYTKPDIETWTDLMARSLKVAGVRKQDKIHIAYGYGLFTGGLGLHYGAEALGCPVIPMGGGQAARQVQLMAEFQPDIIGATPSYLLAIADEFDRQGLDSRASSARLAICGAEPWSEAMRRQIESRMGLKAVNIYGLSELIGPGVGQEFAHHQDGPTLWEDHFYPEIIDPETGEVLPDGEYGELVLTSLTKEALPIIRYRTGDLTRLLPGTACAMRRIERVRNRSDGMLIIRGVNVFPSQVEDVLTRDPRLAPQYLIEIDHPRHLDTMFVQVESRASLLADESRDLEERTMKTIKDVTGVISTVEVVPPGFLPPSLGRVMDRRAERSR